MKKLFAVSLFSVTLSAFGHGGEDHGAPPPASAGASVAAAPRATAATEEFEVVAMLEGQHLRIFVDRFASNEPVAGAKVEVDGGLKGLAAEVAPGTYVLDLPAPLPSARHALTISVEAGDAADLLSATLDTSTPVVSQADTPGGDRRIAWGALTVLLAAGMLLAVRRKKSRGL